LLENVYTYFLYNDFFIQWFFLYKNILEEENEKNKKKNKKDKFKEIENDVDDNNNNEDENNNDDKNLVTEEQTEEQTELWKNNIPTYENNTISMASIFQSEYDLKNIPIEIQQFVKYLKQDKGLLFKLIQIY